MSNYSLFKQLPFYIKTYNRLHTLYANVIATIFLFVSLCLAAPASAQTDLTKCYGSCTSGDFTITRAILTDISGNPITSSACNTAGATVTAYLTFTFTNTTQSDRNGIFISGTINGNYIYQCFPGILPKKSSTTYTDIAHSVQWQCGTDLTLSGTFIAWGSASDNVCSQTCSQATPSKCRTVGNLLIQTPLSNNFSSTASCLPGNNYQTVCFTGTASGGNHVYKYSWNFGDGTTSTDQNPCHTYSSASTFNVTFTVTDGTSTSKSVTKQVTVASCCTTPTISTQPSQQTKCDGSAASFTVASTSGNPAPTTQWQVSTDGGTSWSNLSNTAPYNGVTTNTLSISSATTALNGNLYRAVLTSGTCTPATSDAALLTVNGIPDAPLVGVVNNCDGTSDLTASNYTGDLLWSNSAVTPSIHVTNTATYTVTQTVLGCTSGPGSGTSAPNNLPDRPVVTLQEATICGTNAVPTLTVSCPVVGTYTFKQTGQPDLTVTYTGSNGPVKFNVKPGLGGFSITVTNSAGCTSAATDCSNYTSNSCASSTARIAKAIVPEPVISKTTIKAFPNPFNDKIRFSLQSDISGKGSLDLYNLVGQKVKTVYQGYVEKGQMHTIDYSVPPAQRTNLIYVFTLGTQRLTGKLIGLN